MTGLGDEDLEAQLAELDQVLLVHIQHAALKELQWRAACFDLIWLLQETLERSEGKAKDLGIHADAAAGADNMEEDAMGDAVQPKDAVRADDAAVQAGDTDMHEVRAHLCAVWGQGRPISQHQGSAGGLWSCKPMRWSWRQTVPCGHLYRCSAVPVCFALPPE